MTEGERMAPTPQPDTTTDDPATRDGEMNDHPTTGDHRQAQSRPVVRTIKTMLRGLLALAILAGGVWVALWFNWTEGTVQTSSTEESARLVDVTTVQRGDRQVTLHAMGDVRPAREVVIRPRVSGKITEQNASFVPGGHFQADQTMVQIDQSDYRDAITQRESELQQARATLKIERGDQAVAREELQILEADIPQINRDLILRKPQVNQAKASVKSAQAALNQARADLNRTTIEAPFDGHIVSRSVTAGNNVSAGDQMAEYVGSDHYWIQVAVPVAHLRWIDLPGPDQAKGSAARITDAHNWGDNAFRRGHVTRLIGQLESQSRMAQVLVRVDDPLALSAEHEDKPRLILDAFVDVALKGQTLDDVVAIDRSYLRANDVVWVMNDENRLDIREVTVAFRGQQTAYIRDGLNDGEQLIKTNLAAPVPDMLLRTADADKDPGISGNGETDDE
jgi:RND family efflux transporter MFP subunit